jgi:hypothetical protein
LERSDANGLLPVLTSEVGKYFPNYMRSETKGQHLVKEIIHTHKNVCGYDGPGYKDQAVQLAWTKGFRDGRIEAHNFDFRDADKYGIKNIRVKFTPAILKRPTEKDLVGE